jgi:hypothetical protein
MSEKGMPGPARGAGASYPWRVPLAQTQVPEGGLRLDMVADAKVRAQIAELAGLTGLPRLEASFDVTRHGRSGLHVTGHVSATVGQTCGVTLEPIENDVDEEIDLVFVPCAAPMKGEHERKEIAVPLTDSPEALIDGVVDVGALATEFLVLGIDPYPRKPGSVFQSPHTPEDSAHPFAALSALKKDPRSRRE